VKLCMGCNEEKSEEQFSWKNRSLGKRTSRCKSCHSTYSKTHYKENSKYYKAKSIRNSKSAILENRTYLKEFLENNPCVDCGFSDIRALQFDHEDPLNNSKAPRVSSLIKGSLKRLKEEVAKCSVRCANCHFIKTREQMGWDAYN